MKLILSLMAVLGVIAPAVAQPGPNLTQQQISKLKALGAQIVAPTYLPDGCGKPALSIETDGLPGVKSFTIEYFCVHADIQRRLIIAGANGGFGGGPPVRTKVVYVPALNKKVNLELHEFIVGPGDKTAPHYASEFVKIGTFSYSVQSSSRSEESPAMPEDEMVKVIKSMKVIQ